MRRARTVNNERGTIKALLVILILACMVYVGFKLGIPYYKYSAFKSEAKEIARISRATQIGRTQTQIYERARELNIPIEEEDITVTQTANGLHVETGWTETVDFLGLYQYTFDFVVDVEG
jgi:hypothetical protein